MEESTQAKSLSSFRTARPCCWIPAKDIKVNPRSLRGDEFIEKQRSGNGSGLPAIGNAADIGHCAVQHSAVWLPKRKLPERIQLILGRYWTKATPDQQTSFKSLLVDYAIGSWSKQLAALPPDERIDITGAVAGTDGHVIVHASSISAKETIPVDWLVAKADDGHWAVVDVTAEGVSVMQTMKGDFTAIIRAHGGNMDALLEALRQKIASFGK